MPKKISKTHASVSTTASSSSNASLPEFLTDGLALPSLFVFDLDYTLWPFWVDTHVTPPIKPVPSATHTTAVADRTGDTFKFYCDVPSILHALSLQPSVRIAVASRTSAPDLGREMLKLLYVGAPGGQDESVKKANKARKALDLFDGGLEIYPSGKIRHMKALNKKTGVKYEDMLFFDDESRNRDVETLGVTMWLVRDGTSWKEVENGVMEWRKRRGVR